MLNRTCCAVALSGLAFAAVGAAAATSAPASIVGRNIHIAFDDPADVSKATEFTIDFGASQTCQIANGLSFPVQGDGMSSLSVHESETGASYFWWQGESPNASAMGITTETVTGPPGSGLGGMAEGREGVFAGRYVITMLVMESTESVAADWMAASLALDVTCERPVTVSARSGDTLRFLPDHAAPVSAYVPFAAEADLFGEWDMTIDEHEGHLRAGIWGRTGAQAGEMHLATPDEKVDISLPKYEALHLTAGPGPYRVEITQMSTVDDSVWVAAYGLAGPLDLTPFLRDEPVIWEL